jgi:hypothetical protein
VGPPARNLVEIALDDRLAPAGWHLDEETATRTALIIARPWAARTLRTQLQRSSRDAHLRGLKALAPPRTAIMLALVAASEGAEALTGASGHPADPGRDDRSRGIAITPANEAGRALAVDGDRRAVVEPTLVA